MFSVSAVGGKPTHDHRHVLEVVLAKTVWTEAILERIDFCRVTLKEVNPQCHMKLEYLEINLQFVPTCILV